jgi:hypothetical protein
LVEVPAAVVVVEVDGVVVVVAVVLVVAAHAPWVSPCARCAGTAGLAMLIVCDFPEPVWWQTSTFSCPWPSPDVEVSCVVVVLPVVLVV